PVQLTVQPAVVPSLLSVTPATMNLSSIAGAGAFNANSILVTASGPSVQFTITANSSGWLGISPASGTTPGQAVVSVNASGLQAGVYTGTIVVTAPAASNTPQVVNVNLTVQPSQTLTLSANTLTFSTQMDAPGPLSKTVVASAS